MDLTIINDGRHSVPRRLRLEVDGKVVEGIDLPDIPVAKDAEPNATSTFKLTFPPHTGKAFTIAVDEPTSLAARRARPPTGTRAPRS